MTMSPLNAELAKHGPKPQRKIGWSLQNHIHTLFVAKEKKHLWINYVIDTPHGNIYDADLVLSKMLIFLALWRSVSHYTVAFQKKVVIRNTRILYIP